MKRLPKVLEQILEQRLSVSEGIVPALPYGKIASTVGRMGTHLGAAYELGSPVYNALEPKIGSVPASAATYAATAPVAGAVEGAWAAGSALAGGQGLGAAASTGLGAAIAGTAAELASPLGWGLAIGVPALMKLHEYESNMVDSDIRQRKAERELENFKRKETNQPSLPEINAGEEKAKYYQTKMKAWSITP